jgi:hypothetical protein
LYVVIGYTIYLFGLLSNILANVNRSLYLLRILIYIYYTVYLLSDTEKDSDKRRMRELARDIVNELLKSDESIRVDVTTGGTAERCGPSFGHCGGSYECIKKFRCEHTGGFTCGGTFKDSPDFTLTLG